MKKFIFVIATICMMAASVCLTSCGKDDESTNPTPTPEEVKTYSETLKISASISPEIKDMLKLHYYEVDNSGEKEVAEISTINEVHTNKGTYNRGIKITSEIKQAEGESTDDFKERTNGIIKAWVEKSGKKYSEISLKGNLNFQFTSPLRAATKVTDMLSLQEAVELYGNEQTEEELFMDIIRAFYADILFMKDSFNFAYSTTIADKFSDCKCVEYTWTKY